MTVTPRSPSYSQVIQPIWDRYCNSCHWRDTPRLTPGQSWSKLLKGGSNWHVCGRFVIPGKPEESLLYYKLTKDPAMPHDAAPDCSRAMPDQWDGGGGMALVKIDPAAVENVRLWIQGGALDD